MALQDSQHLVGSITQSRRLQKVSEGLLSLTTFGSKLFHLILFICCVYLCACVWEQACVYMCVHACGGQKTTSGGPLPYMVSAPFFFLMTGSFTGLEFTKQPGVIGQWTPEISLSLPPEYWDYRPMPFITPGYVICILRIILESSCLHSKNFTNRYISSVPKCWFLRNYLYFL